MANKKVAALELVLRLGDAAATGDADATGLTGGARGLVEVEMANHSTSPLTVVTATRYFLFEMRSTLGQYLRGGVLEKKPLGLPSSGDYRRVPPGGSVVLPVPLAWVASAGDASIGLYSVGEYQFVSVPARNTLRVTYRADQIMPNLPNADRRLFFAGPADDTIELLRGALYLAPPPTPGPD